MNIVKQSLFICIGVLLALIGLEGAQSLWQVSRVHAAANDIVASARLSSEARILWTRFLDAEQTFKQATAFVDAASADELRKEFGSKASVLKQQVASMQSGAGDGEVKSSVSAVSDKVDKWMSLAAPHIGAEGVTELPSYHLLESARTAVEIEVGKLLTGSAKAAEASVATTQSLVHDAYVWTISEVILAVILGLVLGRFAMNRLHQQLGADASEVARIANAVADGDLSVSIRTEGVPAGSVMAATARMQSALLETVSKVRSISGNLATGAQEIATGNSDLSQRTEQQSVALEKTAATMEQLGTAVRHNADNATQASRLADQASTVASEGGAVVDRAVETMRSINDSSKKIVDIIGVIDGIAFQTNILALNAAVEAARAGEQGRGFAVVATEVRSLAGRSADAAKEIKRLITSSVERVEAGSALVDEAGDTMRGIVQAIHRVTAVMSQIQTATSEQSEGVSQIGHAVAEMDRSTQQNAALAEESAAAAESLTTQGKSLLDAMSFFKLRAGGPYAALGHEL